MQEQAENYWVHYRTTNVLCACVMFVLRSFSLHHCSHEKMYILSYSCNL